MVGLNQPTPPLKCSRVVAGGGPTADGEPGGVVHLEPLDGELALASHWVVMLQGLKS